MPIREYACRCGARFERLEPLATFGAPVCPACGAGVTRRVPSRFATSGQADVGPERSSWPRTWEQVGHGDRETIARWQRTVERRLDLEARHPELAAPPRQPVTSHEGGHVHLPDGRTRPASVAQRRGPEPPRSHPPQR